ncbi:hypothetical protein [Mycolicibacterium mageritense]|uniref:hypothetical protein n=1 Tax=Mycolicibacterium mageritense TaxID=53462 RepID=UPI000432C1DB|nr:hypothetical protein [Mycolicibacterium mageritense]MCC9184139.1 hypothetical protein [Mycolicibacterium mageritense]CDO27224.1 hypothetical protein BN978_07790 [Mycolicibacterium mageritense DSM 44476 = CIP 104973]
MNRASALSDLTPGGRSSLDRPHAVDAEGADSIAPRLTAGVLEGEPALGGQLMPRL